MTNLTKNLWLPYNQMKITAPPLKVKNAEGCKIFLDDGRVLIDGIASWWTACHGYKHPHIIKSVATQLEQLPHIMFGGLVHEPAIKLSEILVKILPAGLSKVFFSDSGSTAVEVAMKMAVQYWNNKGNKQKNRFICFKNGYHGDSMGAMSVSDSEQGIHKVFSSYMPMQYLLELPIDEYAFAEFRELLKSIKKNVAGIIIEPLLQAAGGMKFYSSDILAEIRKIATENDILFIADEIATGFGRTGMMFACNEAGITPDIMCIGKALTGGVIGLAATVATNEIFQEFYSDKPEQALMHGPTYMANPLACTAAIASIELFSTENRLKQVEQIETALIEDLKKCKGLQAVKDVRIKGAVAAVQLKNSSYQMNQNLRKRFIEKNVWIRPIEDVIYLMPAFTISTQELETLCHAVFEVCGDL